MPSIKDILNFDLGRVAPKLKPSGGVKRFVFGVIFICAFVVSYRFVSGGWGYPFESNSRERTNPYVELLNATPTPESPFTTCYKATVEKDSEMHEKLNTSEKKDELIPYYMSYYREGYLNGIYRECLSANGLPPQDLYSSGGNSTVQSQQPVVQQPAVQQPAPADDCTAKYAEYNACLSEYNAKMTEYESCITENLSSTYDRWCFKPANYCRKPLYC